ncbi:MAG TPA: nitroreductase family protein [Firmicutes bacterium]|nr:nitroreductase family protein [Bacillota bacterium]
MTKDVFDAIRERRSVRSFEQKLIPDAIINRLIEAAVQAPTAGGVEPWRFFVVLNEKIRTCLSEAAFGQKFVAAAPCVIVVCGVPAEAEKAYGRRGRELYLIQDTAAAVENILLAATALGLGTCWVGAFDEGRAARCLNLDPSVIRPLAIIPLGYPAERPSPRRRKSLPEVCTWMR